VKRLFIFTLLVMLTPVRAQSLDHGIYDELLGKYVTDGRVDYTGFLQEKDRLELYLGQLQTVTRQELNSWTVDEQKTFWINAYNAATLEAVLNHYPIKPGGFISRARFPKNSIRQIPEVWDTPLIRLAGKMRTLNEIEHEILRRQYHDPRLHFVLVCASIGCPLLENNAFMGIDIEIRLDQASRNFLSNPGKMRIDRSSNTLFLSSIFRWFGEDFRSTGKDASVFSYYPEDEQGIISFLLKYGSEETARYIRTNHPKIKYLNYDWSLNER